MTTKEKIVSAMQNLDDNASFDDAIERLYLLQKLEIGVRQLDDGHDLMDHEDFMNELSQEED